MKTQPRKQLKLQKMASFLTDSVLVMMMILSDAGCLFCGEGTSPMMTLSVCYSILFFCEIFLLFKKGISICPWYSYFLILLGPQK